MIADLISGQIARLCQMPDGRLTPDAESPAVLLCGSFNPLHAGHLQLAAAAASKLGRPAAFEIGVINADKPPLAESEVRRRLRQFEWVAPVWLAREPTFAGKARLFPGATFVVGVDTADRIVQPRFYGGEDEARAALAVIRASNCRFLVAGRVDAGSRFRGVESLELADDLFMGIAEAEFRADVSSTALRMVRAT
jgi:hypothetical protein